MEIPSITLITVTPSTASSGSCIVDMRGTNISSIQLDTIFSNPGDTDAVTLLISNDGVNFCAFATNKTVTFTGGTTDHAMFQLGVVDYAWLKISYAAPSAHTFSASGILYSTATITRES